MVNEQYRRTTGNPFEIRSDQTSFLITNPNRGIAVSVQIYPNNTVSTRVTDLRADTIERRQLKTDFTKTTRIYIAAKINSEAAEQATDTTDNVAPVMSADELDTKVGGLVKRLRKNGCSEQEMIRMIKAQGRSFSGGKKFDEMPDVVKEIVTDLEKRVIEFYKKSEKGTL